MVGASASGQHPATVVYWACATYLFGWLIEESVVETSGDDSSNTSWLHYPYSTECVYLYQCGTVFEDGVYTTTCN